MKTPATKFKQKIQLISSVTLISISVLLGFDLINIQQYISIVGCMMSVYTGTLLQKLFFKEEYKELQIRQKALQNDREQIIEDATNIVIEKLNNRNQ